MKMNELLGLVLLLAILVGLLYPAVKEAAEQAKAQKAHTGETGDWISAVEAADMAGGNRAAEAVTRHFQSVREVELHVAETFTQNRDVRVSRINLGGHYAEVADEIGAGRLDLIA